MPHRACSLHCAEIAVAPGRAQVVECDISAGVSGRCNAEVPIHVCSRTRTTVSMSRRRERGTLKGCERRRKVARRVSSRVADLGPLIQCLGPRLACRRLAKDCREEGVPFIKCVKFKAKARVISRAPGSTALEGEHVVVRILGRRQSCERCQKKNSRTADHHHKIINSDSANCWHQWQRWHCSPLNACSRERKYSDFYSRTSPAQDLVDSVERVPLSSRSCQCHCHGTGSCGSVQCQLQCTSAKISRHVSLQLVLE